MTTTATEPPLCNTGANPLSNLLTWDWYQGTVKGLTSADGLMSVVAREVSPGSVWKPVPGLYGYAAGRELLGVEVGSVRVFWGGSDVHVQATGGAADTLADVLRRWWPEHTVSRADVAFDVVEPGSFERLYAEVHRLARDGAARGGRKVSTSTAGDWLDRENGRTFYAGGPSSRVRVRVYEKGHEQRVKDPLCGASLDWTRVEWQLRPTSDQKRWLASASKADALGLSPFGATVADAVLGSDVVPVGAELRFASQDPAYWMTRQYRRVVLALLELDAEDLRDRLVQLVEQTGPSSVVDGSPGRSPLIVTGYDRP